jgi:hypothetical protein
MSPSQLPIEGQSQIIDELLDRQDDVLNGLDELNGRIELLICEINQDRRKSQVPPAQTAEPDQQSNSESDPDEMGLSEAA